MISGNREISEFFLHFMMNDSDGDGDSVDIRLAPNNLASNDHADVEIISLPQPIPLKRKRVKNNDPPSIPEVDGLLTIIVHIITTTASGDLLTKSRKSYSFKVESAAHYVNNIDHFVATKNVAVPTTLASTVHGLLINHFGQNASDLLVRLGSGHEPYLIQKLKANSNSESSVSIQTFFIHLNETSF